MHLSIMHGWKGLGTRLVYICTLCEPLAVDTYSDDNVEDVHIVDSVALNTNVLASKMRKQLRLATWNVSDLCSERKQKRLLSC